VNVATVPLSAAFTWALTAAGEIASGGLATTAVPVIASEVAPSEIVTVKLSVPALV
jgi:hypothetical protein